MGSPLSLMPPAPCTWPIDRYCYQNWLPQVDGAVNVNDPEYPTKLAIQLACEDTAVQVLWALSGRQYGICPTLVRPCAEAHQPLEGRWGPIGAFTVGMLVGLDDFGDIFTMQDGWCGKCLISSPRAVDLPGPVYQDATGNYPVSVMIHDYVLDEDEYSVEGDRLFHLHGEWPFQDFSRELGEHNTWSVAYWRGTPPPAILSRFAGVLTNEFIQASCGGKCRIPRTVQHISRGGVSFDTFNPDNIYSTGKTGIPEIDMWLASINPNKLMQAPTVL
jgi:hypothetical protein